MKEEAKMKENSHMEHMGTMPAAHNMPMTLPATIPETLPAQTTMPYMMQMPMMCCPVLMNMQCPMLYGPATFSPNMGVSPAAFNPNMGVRPAA